MRDPVSRNDVDATPDRLTASARDALRVEAPPTSSYGRAVRGDRHDDVAAIAAAAAITGERKAGADIQLRYLIAPWHFSATGQLAESIRQAAIDVAGYATSAADALRENADRIVAVRDELAAV